MVTVLTALNSVTTQIDFRGDLSAFLTKMGFHARSILQTKIPPHTHIQSGLMWNTGNIVKSKTQNSQCKSQSS